jgi:uncharacterized protein involved in exopolysaccharide biosynthesis
MEHSSVTEKSTSQQNNEKTVNSTLPPEVILLSQQIAQQNDDDEIDLSELFRAIWLNKLTIIIISFIFSVASVAFALSKPDIYKASVLLSPASSEGAGAMGALAGQFGGLASLAGINLGGAGTDKTALALEIIKSRGFLEHFIAKHELLIPIMASKKWDQANNALILDNEIYDASSEKWIRDVQEPKKPKPSLWEAYQELLELISASQDKTTSLVTISLEFYSPDIAKQWLIWLVEDVNNSMREQDEKEAKASIDYLTSQLDKTEVSAMKTVFYQLIEEQTKNMMLTKISDEYVLKTIDPAQVPEKKAGPKRALIIVLGTLLGAILSVLIVLVTYFTNNKKSTKPKEEILA